VVYFALLLLLTLQVAGQASAQLDDLAELRLRPRRPLTRESEQVGIRRVERGDTLVVQMIYGLGPHLGTLLPV
jgi:hypothetical protein